MSSRHLYHDSTVDGIPTDEAELHPDIGRKHARAAAERLQEQYASLRYSDSAMQALQEMQARHSMHAAASQHLHDRHHTHEELHGGHHLQEHIEEEEHPDRDNSHAGLAASHYASLMDVPSLQHQAMAQYHSQAYYQHLAAAQYHQGHLQDPQNSLAYLSSMGQLQATYGLVMEDPAVGVEVEKDDDLVTMNEEDAAAHLTALRNSLQHVEAEELRSQHAAHGHALESHAYYGEEEPYAEHIASHGSGRKRWRSMHDTVDEEQELIDASKIKRKQNRRPDRLCHFEGCSVTPTYNYPGQKKRVFCVTHKKEGMVNVVAKRCAHLDCVVNPRFNYEGQTRGLYCSEHKLQGMVNVIDRRCQEENCKKFPSHNYPGMHKKLYCATHKREGMVDMSHGSSSAAAV